MLVVFGFEAKERKEIVIKITGRRWVLWQTARGIAGDSDPSGLLSSSYLLFLLLLFLAFVELDFVSDTLVIV